MRRQVRAQKTGARRGKKNKVAAQGAKAEHAEEAFNERVCWHSLAIVNLAPVKVDSEVAHAHGFEIEQTEQFGTGAAVLWNGQAVSAGAILDRIAPRKRRDAAEEN